MTDERPMGGLQPCKIEGRVLVSFIAVCRERLGEEVTRELVTGFIRQASIDDGAKAAERFGDDMAGLRRIAEEVWGGPGGGVDLQMLYESDDRLDFDVTRCGYAQLCKEWGLSDLGFQLECSRDHAMLLGFNDDIEPRTVTDDHAGCGLL